MPVYELLNSKSLVIPVIAGNSATFDNVEYDPLTSTEEPGRPIYTELGNELETLYLILV